RWMRERMAVTARGLAEALLFPDKEDSSPFNDTLTDDEYTCSGDTMRQTGCARPVRNTRSNCVESAETWFGPGVARGSAVAECRPNQPLINSTQLPLTNCR